MRAPNYELPRPLSPKLIIALPALPYLALPCPLRVARLSPPWSLVNSKISSVYFLSLFFLLAMSSSSILISIIITLFLSLLASSPHYLAIVIILTFSIHIIIIVITRCWFKSTWSRSLIKAREHSVVPSRSLTWLTLPLQAAMVPLRSASLCVGGGGRA